MQAHGAEMLRLACCEATERGVPVCAPVHDAVLLCSPLDRLDHDVAEMRAAMAKASGLVLGGFQLTTEVRVTRYPQRYMEGRGKSMWSKVSYILSTIIEDKGTERGKGSVIPPWLWVVAEDSRPRLSGD
jgi:hypothetical protein